MLEELLVEARMADLYRGLHGPSQRTGFDAPVAHRIAARFTPIVERPHPEARRILGRWLLARRAARAVEGRARSA